MYVKVCEEKKVVREKWKREETKLLAANFFMGVFKGKRKNTQSLRLIVQVKRGQLLFFTSAHLGRH